MNYPQKSLHNLKSLKLLSVFVLLSLSGCGTTVTSLNIDNAVGAYEPWQVAADYYLLRTAPHMEGGSLFTSGQQFVMLAATEPSVLKQYELVMLEQGMERKELESVRQGRVYVGMSEEGAIAAWGRPDDINRTTTQYSSQEQWVYSRPNYDNDYLYFEDGIVTAIQN